MSQTLHETLDKALEIPPILNWRMKRHYAAFSKGQYGGSCRGLYKSYREAADAAPTTLPLGYDSAGPAAMYRDRLEQVFPSDYAMMLWLGKAFADGAKRLFDLGGHVGVGYYAYQRYLAYPEALSWQVFDVPAVIKVGKELALERDRRRALAFVDQFEQAGAADVLFTSGCLQYLEDTLAEKLATLPRKPRWLLVNLLPLHDHLAYWTVQSIGSAFCPYRIQRKSIFFSDLENLGYEVRDIWTNPEKRCEIAFHPEHSLNGYFGAALTLR